MSTVESGAIRMRPASKPSTGRTSRWSLNSRQINTPLTIGSFLITALTGLLIFFEIEFGGIRPTHEWMSIVFVGASILHITTNRKPFVRYFAGKTLLLINSMLVGGSLLFVLTFEDVYLADASYEIVVGTELNLLPQLLDQSSADINAKIQALGITIETDTQSLKDLAQASAIDEHEILEALVEN